MDPVWTQGAHAASEQYFTCGFWFEYGWPRLQLHANLATGDCHLSATERPLFQDSTVCFKRGYYAHLPVGPEPAFPTGHVMRRPRGQRYEKADFEKLANFLDQFQFHDPQHRFVMVQHVSPLWRAMDVKRDGHFVPQVHQNRQKLHGRRLMWFSPLDDPRLNYGSFYGTVVFATPLHDLLRWYEKEVCPKGDAMRLYFVEENNDHRGNGTTAEHPYIYLLTFKPYDQGREVDLQEGDGRISRDGNQFLWRKASDRPWRVPYAFFDLAIEFPEGVEVPLARLPYLRCCDKRRTKVVAWQDDHWKLTADLAASCLELFKVLLGDTTAEWGAKAFIDFVTQELQLKYNQALLREGQSRLQQFFNFACAELKIPDEVRHLLIAELHTTHHHHEWERIRALALVSIASRFPDRHAGAPPVEERRPSRPLALAVWCYLQSRLDLCFACQEHGHWAKHCPQRVCLRCGHIGHWAAECAPTPANKPDIDRRGDQCYQCQEFGHWATQCPY